MTTELSEIRQQLRSLLRALEQDAALRRVPRISLALLARHPSGDVLPEDGAPRRPFGARESPPRSLFEEAGS